MRLRRTASVVFALFLVVVMAPGVLAQEKGNHFFWRVSHGNQFAYILGSIHMAGRDLYPLAPVIERQFKAADVLVLEVDLSAVDPLMLQMSMVQRAMYTDGSTLKSNLSRTQYARLSRTLQKLNMDIEQYQMFQPWFVALMITQEGLQRMGLSENYGVDRYFFDRSGGKQIKGLESADYQISVISSMAFEDQLAFITYSSLELKSLKREMQKMLMLWKTGNVDGMEQMIMTPLKGNPRLRSVYDALFATRNRNMARRIDQMLKSDPQRHFIIIGAGHLVGADGVPALLRNKGYKVEQL